MNPELLRNLWLELAPRRVGLFVLVLVGFLILGATQGNDAEPGARVFFYLIVVVWGTRSAARAIVEEIAGRTWDAQRLSAIRPWSMVWGKLLGATSLAWVGGAICLVPILAKAAEAGPQAIVRQLAYFLSLGLLSQAAAMLASQVAVRRGLGHSRFDVFLYQAFGLAAAGAIWRVWQAVDPDSLFRQWGRGNDVFAVDAVSWWTGRYDTGQFYAASLVVFAAWTLIANYRLMRLELQMRNGPFVWLGFLAFTVVYMGGFDPWRDTVGSYGNEIALRAAQAAVALIIVTYVIVFAEPKDIVAYRRLLGHFSRGRVASLLSEWPAWVMAYGATAVMGALIVLAAPSGASGFNGDWSLTEGASVVVAALGFVLRDCLIVIAFGLGQRGKRSDFAAGAVLVMLYVVVPDILGFSRGPMVFFYPGAFQPIWLNPLFGWGEAAVVAALILRRPDLRQPAPS